MSQCRLRRHSLCGESNRLIPRRRKRIFQVLIVGQPGPAANLGNLHCENHPPSSLTNSPCFPGTLSPAALIYTRFFAHFLNAYITWTAGEFMNDAMRPADATGPIDWRTSSLIPSQSWAWHSMDGRRRRCLPHPPTPSSLEAGTRFGSPHFGSVRGGRRPAAAAGRAHTHPHATDEEEGRAKGFSSRHYYATTESGEAREEETKWKRREREREGRPKNNATVLLRRKNERSKG